MQICDRTKKRSSHSLFMRQTGSSEICCVRRNRSVKNRRRDILRRWNNPPAVMSDATGRLSGRQSCHRGTVRGKQAGRDHPGDRDQGQADALPAHVAADIFPQERGNKSKTACRGQIRGRCKDTLPSSNDPRLEHSRRHASDLVTQAAALARAPIQQLTWTSSRKTEIALSDEDHHFFRSKGATYMQAGIHIST